MRKMQIIQLEKWNLEEEKPFAASVSCLALYAVVLNSSGATAALCFKDSVIVESHSVPDP